LLIRAQEFFVAAHMVIDRTSPKVFLPSYFLLGHSVELSLKAFLLQQGFEIGTLSRDFGHSLGALLAAGREHQLSDYIPLTDQEIGAIELLTYDYMAKRYEYDESETYFLPLISVTSTVARRLAFGLKGVCLGADGTSRM
jgi:hypothetical protein